ncbi:MAG: hypothetical protein ACRDXX_20380 [Stackebrandtia sp.]
MSSVFPVRYRLTSSQVAGRALRIGCGTAVIAAAATVLVTAGDVPGLELLAVPAAFVAGAAVAFPLVRRGGVDLDESGVRPVIPGPARRECASWQDIVELRAERRGARTVPVIYLDSGKVWRLRTPYDGVLLGGDPHFDEKVCTMRNMWETYRNWQPNSGQPDD